MRSWEARSRSRARRSRHSSATRSRTRIFSASPGARPAGRSSALSSASARAGAWGSSFALPLAGFLGALVAVAVVGAGASAGGRLDRGRLLLSGVVVNALASAILLFLLSFGDAARTQSFVFWMLGSLAGATPGAVKALAVYAALGLALLLPLARAFDALALGEETAATLGIPVETVKRVAYLAASLLAAAAVATTGIIGFVGLLVPHAVRRLARGHARAARPFVPRRRLAPRRRRRARAIPVRARRDLGRGRDGAHRGARVPDPPEGAPVTDTPARLEARALAAGYGARTVLSDVSLSLARGRVSVLLGENGSGKSTLLKALAGVLTPRAGEVLLDGRSLASVPRREAARAIGYLPQGFEPLFPMRALDLVLLGRTPHLGAFGAPGAADRAAAEGALAEMDAAALSSADLRAMSGGERQRVLLARVLAGAPSVLLLDEPTANLDPRHRFLVLDAMRRRAAAGGTVLFSTHELDVASQGADDAVLLAGGRVLAGGPLATTLTDRLLSELFAVAARVTSGSEGRPLVSFGPPPAR